MIRSARFAALLVFLAPQMTWAASPEIRHVEVTKPDMGWQFTVTVKHPDSGWDHFADGWEVVDMQGNRLAYRQLHHPHVHEQPFTRSLRGVMIPDGTREVIIRARCSEDGWIGEEVRVKLSPAGRGKY